MRSSEQAEERDCGNTGLRLPLPNWTVLAGLAVLLTGCQAHDTAVDFVEFEGPWRVNTAPLEGVPEEVFVQSGTVRARREIPLAFQVPGRIANRYVDAGVRVREGDLLFELDPKDFLDQVAAAEAQLRAVEAEATEARRQLERQREMIRTNATSQMALEQAETGVEVTRQQVAAAQSQLALAKNALAYTKLLAPTDGLLIDVTGEPAQVVSVGREVARLAEAGPVDVEVALPQSLIENAPQYGECIVDSNGKRYHIELREVSGAADLESRTWRARYRVLAPDADLPLGSVVRVRLPLARAQPDLRRVPATAVDERAGGARVWLIQNQQAESTAVEVVEYKGLHCIIRTDLPVGTPVISMGTHLLQEGMKVEALGG
ncbi:MAG: RND transporter MFP subunit [Pirellulaceae bacterium]|nr:MAG: RND transporter MFP subunit [Pirellulaceae bacterium]